MKRSLDNIETGCPGRLTDVFEKLVLASC